MPLLNYTTQIQAEKTCGEIQRLLAKAGAAQVLTEYDDEHVLSAISFRLLYREIMVTFRLPANIDNVYVLLQRQVDRPKYRTREQAARVAWRIIKDWIEAQIALVQAEQVEMVEVFLPYAQNPATGETMFQMMERSDMALLSAPV